MRTRACTRMAAQMTRPALGSTPGRCLRQPRSSAAIAHSQPSRSTFRTVRACSACRARAEHAHARACMHAHRSADDTASARQYASPLPRSSAAPPSRPPGHPRPAALLLSRDTSESSSLREETMGMSGVVKSKLSVFFPHGTVNTLFFVGFPGDIRKKKPTEAMFRGSFLFATPKTCF